MKKRLTLILLSVVLSLVITQLTSAARSALVIPTFTIQAVDSGKTVTIKGQNFIPKDIYTVTMGKFGTRGVGGIVVGKQNAGTGTFTATYNIPDSLKDLTTIAIRLQSPTTGYYSYNWFWNKDQPTTTGDPVTTPKPSGISWGYPPAGKSTIPNTTITEVTKGVDVTVKGKNFTTKDTYNVYIGKIGTKGVGGVKVATFETNDSGTFEKTFKVPDSLKSETRLAIRFQSPSSGYYGYDWFVNQTGTSTTSPTKTPTATPSGTPSSAIGYPPKGKGTIPAVVFLEVTKDDKVKVQGSNFTTNDTYKVYMGKFGTKAVGGVLVGTQKTSASGTFTATYKIPDSLKGQSLIAIRFESPATGYYAYDFFANK